MDVIRSLTIFLGIRQFLARWHPTNQLGDPSASLLLTSEKAACCNNADGINAAASAGKDANDDDDNDGDMPDGDNLGGLMASIWRSEFSRRPPLY